mgnify:FL=1
MLHEILEKNGRRFVAATSKEDSNTIYIGTVGFFSNISAQMICHEAMEHLAWPTSGTFTNLALDGNQCTGVGYTIPDSKSYDNPLDYLETVF